MTITNTITSVFKLPLLLLLLLHVQVANVYYYYYLLHHVWHILPLLLHIPCNVYYYLLLHIWVVTSTKYKQNTNCNYINIVSVSLIDRVNTVYEWGIIFIIGVGIIFINRLINRYWKFFWLLITNLWYRLRHTFQAANNVQYGSDRKPFWSSNGRSFLH